jgi:hypothetical protein
VVRLLLEAYSEPTFSVRSHGFRPGRGCHTALREVANTWTGTTWFVEGDIADCFGSLDHQVMIRILSEKIHDNRFLRLITKMLTAGYLEDWTWNATLSGAPQGSGVSPVLSNIYLHKLDEFVETHLIPEHTLGDRRSHDRGYHRIMARRTKARARGDQATAKQLRKQLRTMPRSDPGDPGYRRLRYTRYADDHLLGFIGPRAEAEQIKGKLAEFLREELKLELSPDKTLITHARTGAARFLGYEITTLHDDSTTTRGRRTVNGKIGLRVPRDVIKAKIAPYLKRGKPARHTPLIKESDFTIVATYGTRFRGIVQYYLLAGDVYRLNRLEWAMKTSMLKTLAAKHGSTVTKMAAKHTAKIQTPHGPRTGFQAVIERPGREPLVARFGGIPLKRQKTAVITDRQSATAPVYPRKELVTRLLRGQCELCGSTESMSVHHIRKLADLAATDSQPAWAAHMADKRRKSLVVCATCHEAIHTETPTAPHAQ